MQQAGWFMNCSLPKSDQEPKKLMYGQVGWNLDEILSSTFWCLAIFGPGTLKQHPDSGHLPENQGLKNLFWPESGFWRKVVVLLVAEADWAGPIPPTSSRTTTTSN